MKKLALIITFLSPLFALAQTTVTRTVQPNLDTLVTTTTVSSVTLKYKPPVVTPPPNTNPGGTISGPVTCQSNTTYKYLTIDLTNTPYSKGFNVSGKTNVHITHCKIINGKSFGVWVGAGSSNIAADSNLVSNIGAAFYAENSSSIKFNGNQVLNVNGNGTLWTFGHDFQFVNISGSGNQISYNKGEDIAGVAINPHDRVSLYKCFPSDTIFVCYNEFRGGQRALQSGGKGGACGITITDVSGNLQVVRGNILVNTGYAGIQCIGSGTNVRIDHNIVFSAVTPISLLGFSVQDKNQIYCGYNQCKWYRSDGSIFNYWTSSSPIPVAWSTNVWSANIDANILPVKLITWQ